MRAWFGGRRNMPFMWRRGCVVTSPEEGLWDHFGKVSKEDVKHMKNRFEAFRCLATVANCADVDPCAAHMCKWLVQGAQAADAAVALRSSLPVVLPTASRPAAPAAAAIAGLAELGQAAMLPEGAVAALRAELEALGVVHVGELESADWESMAAFQGLRKFEQRRLLKAAGPA